MNLSTGVDVIEIERVREALERHGDRFLERIFTQQERQTCGVRVASLAARFAAKEAVSKALGTGIGEIAWQEIEICTGPAGEPSLTLSGAAARLAEEKGLQNWSVSLSHSREHAVAMVVAWG